MTATISGDGTSTLINLTTSGNTVLGDASTDTLNVGNGGLVKDASGNVGIGIASPGGRLDIAGVGRLRIDTSNDYVYQTIINASGVAYKRSIVDALQHEFYASGSEKMRIDSSGNLLVGGTSQIFSERLLALGTGTNVFTSYQNTNTSGYSSIRSFLQPNGNNTSTYHFLGGTSGVGSWYLYGNGTSSWSSDSRLKKNIETTRNGYLDDICRLRVVKYNWKNDADDTPRELGLIAQEVEQVFPGLVQDGLEPLSEDDPILYKQFKGSVLPFMLLKSIQEQQALIVSMREELDALKTKVGA